MDSFLSCDWGTSTFRLRRVDGSSLQISAEIKTNEGILDTYNQWLATGRPEAERIDFYLGKLKDAIVRLPEVIEENMPVVLSGMASSTIGMVELPYREFPFSWDLNGFPVKMINGNEKFSHPLFLVSGYKTDDDVMRGEETLLLGCEIVDEDEKIFIFPGTHSKHVFVKNGSGIDFKTYMTGEMFNLLSEKSILRHAVAKGSDEKSFLKGFKAGLNDNVLHQAFMVRTGQLLHDQDPVHGYAFLSGLLIGAELTQLKGNNNPVYLVCSETFKQPYLSGLTSMNLNREVFYLNADEILLKAHHKIADHFYKQKPNEK